MIRNTILTLILALSTSSALATEYKQCPDGTVVGRWDDCPPSKPEPEPPVVTPAPVTVDVDTSQQQNSAAGAIAVATGGASTATGGNATGGSSSAQGGDQAVTLGDVGSTSGASSSAAGGSVGDIQQRLSSDSTSSAYSGGNDLATSSSADGSGNATVNVDSTDRSITNYTSQALGLAPIMTAAPTIVPGAGASVVYGQCGPIMAKESEEVRGLYYGMWKKHRDVIGRNDRIVEHSGALFEETHLDGRLVLIGRRAVRTVAVLNISGSRQIGLGGGSTGGGWGQGGASGGSAMQQVVQQIDFEPCIAYMQEAPTLPLIEFTEPRVPRG